MKTYLELLSERIGFAAAFTGGSEPYVVGNLDDSGPGSLRYGAALGGRFITADPALSGALPLPSAIPVAPDTLIALGPAVWLSHVGDWHHGLRFQGPNIGVAYTKLLGNNPPGEHGNASDGIHIDGPADLIWIAHNQIEAWRDGAIDTETHQAVDVDRISIVWNKIKDTRLAINLWAERVSFGFNRVTDCSGRGPKITNGKLHSFNNVTKRWGGSNIRQTGGVGQMLSDYDMFIIGDGDNKVGTSEPTSAMRHNNHKAFDAPITLTGEIGTVDPAFVSAARANSTYEQPATTTAWKALRTLVETASGADDF